MEAMEKSFLHASNLTAQHKKEWNDTPLDHFITNFGCPAAKSLEEARQAAIASQANKNTVNSRSSRNKIRLR